MSLSSIKKYADLQIPFEDLLSATKNFSEENFITETTIGKSYKGKLSRSGQQIDIVAEMINSDRFGDIELYKGVSTLYSLQPHRNLTSVIGFYDNGRVKMIITKREANGSLDQFVADPNLTWMQRLQICVGIAQALSYIYYQEGRDTSVIHCDIRSCKILLDDKWEPKLSGFEFSLTQTADRRDDPCLTGVCGSFGSSDPEYEKLESASHKSDVYAFGVVLFEVLCGKKAILDEQENLLSFFLEPAEILLSTLAVLHYEGESIDEIIHPGLRKQMDQKSLNLFSETAYRCLKEKRSQRPNINQILTKLKEALGYQWKHDNPGKSIVKVTKSLKWKNLKHLEIPLSDIVSATENFAEIYIIGSGTFGDVYRTKLYHFDSTNDLTIEEKNNWERPKKCSTVAIKKIKRVSNGEDREGLDTQGEEGFYAEIDMLTNCKHPNIVSLIGFCREDGHMILVYEYASNGSLENYLGSTAKLTNLMWVDRIKICIGIAKGLSYLHNKIEDERRIIHRDIKSGNILLDDNWVVKIADFGLSKFRPEDRQVNTLNTNTIAGTEVYLDPEYHRLGKLNNKSDIYSVGVVLFEMLSGRIANDSIYTDQDSNGIAPIARKHFNDGTIKEMLDPRLMEKAHERFFTLNKGPDQDSFVAFSEIAHECVAETQAGRPTAEVVIEKLKEALSYQENPKDNLKISLKEIESATQNFSNDNLIGEGRHGIVYKGEITQANGRLKTVAVKRLRDGMSLGEKAFPMELEFLKKYEHENIIGLVGYCNESGENIIVYEYASRGSLRWHLGDYSLTWMKRLEICRDIASGLSFLHGGAVTQEVLIHRDINTYNILLNDDWKAKITKFGYSLISPIDNDSLPNFCSKYTIYTDPVWAEFGTLSKESDTYSLGVILYYILLGDLVMPTYYVNYRLRYVPKLNKDKFHKQESDEMVFEGIKNQIAPKSLATFRSIAYQCIHEKREERPTIREVLLELNKAMESQEDYELWKHKLPQDYKEIIPPEILDSTQREKDLYDMLSKGVLLQEDKVLLLLGDNGTWNEMIPAKRFSYINRCPYRWQSVPESRFKVVAEMLDISNLNIKINTRTRFLSPDVDYGIHLVFKFCDKRKASSKPLYVNLKYRIGSKTSHAYFAKQRDEEWMMIELCRFSNHNKDTVFKFVVESFSRYYCGHSTIYVQGIEFRAIDNDKHDQIEGLEEVQEVLKSDTNMDLLQQSLNKYEEIFEKSDGEKLIWLSKVNGKKTIMLSAKAALYNYSDVKLFRTNPSPESRFPEVIELLPQQVFRINCKIERQMLSRDTNYLCYLVFKLSEKCCGLHCPVKVRDPFLRNKNEAEIIYFRTPSPWNLHDTNQVPKPRTDGWMEVKLWNFNFNRQLINDHFRVNLKLITYEGTMSGLIVCGLEFRPM